MNPITRVPKDKSSPFTRDHGGYLMRSLFLETRNNPDLDPIYTLKDQDKEFQGKTYLSLYRLYMETSDLTEYDFATQYLESWDQWVQLTSKGWFKPYIERWRTELELKLKCEALRRMIKEAVEGGKNSYNANKFIVERGWVPKETEGSRRGRPSKAEIARKAAEEVFSNTQISDAMKRLEIN